MKIRKNVKKMLSRIGPRIFDEVMASYDEQDEES